jgi:hypothetical protein
VVVAIRPNVKTNTMRDEKDIEIGQVLLIERPHKGLNNND